MKINSFARLTSVLAGLAAISLALAGCAPKSPEAPAASNQNATNVTLTGAQRESIHLYTVAPSTYHKTIAATGAVDFDNDQSTSVLAPFGGPVSRLLVTLGGQVKAGDALAEVDSPDFATAIATYRKALATAATNRRLADLDKDLIQHHGVSRREEEQAQTDAANAESDAEAARLGLVSLNVDPQVIKDIQDGKSPTHVAGFIRSPIAGTVVEKLITPGELLQAGTTPCFTIADLSRVWIMAQVFGSDLSAIKLGDTATVETGIGTNTFPGTVDNISALVDPDTRSVMVRVVAQNPGDFLKKQMYVRALIRSAATSTGILVPVSAVLRDDENLPFVYLLQPDNSFARQPVTLGARTDDQFEIQTGLKPGDQIVTDGGIFLQFIQNQ